MKFLAWKKTNKPTKVVMISQSFISNVITVASGKNTNVEINVHLKNSCKKNPKHETTCKLCGKVVYSLPGLLDHLQKEQNVDFTHYCKKCHKLFPSASDVTRHGKSRKCKGTDQV